MVIAGGLRNGFGKQHPERNPVLDFDEVDPASAESIEHREQFDDLGFEQKVVTRAFGARRVVAAEFDFANDAGRGSTKSGSPFAMCKSEIRPKFRSCIRSTSCCRAGESDGLERIVDIPVSCVVDGSSGGQVARRAPRVRPQVFVRTVSGGQPHLSSLTGENSTGRGLFRKQFRKSQRNSNGHRQLWNDDFSPAQEIQSSRPIVENGEVALPRFAIVSDTDRIAGYPKKCDQGL